MTQPSQKKNNVQIRCSHGENDTHITLYLPATNRRHVSVESVECEDPRFKELINKHINDENFLESDIGKHLEEKIKPMMIKNGWINPMHTTVPGPDGQLSYGGYCFPKDTNALLNHMKREGTPHKVLEATVDERNEMRQDHTNVKKKLH